MNFEAAKFEKETINCITTSEYATNMFKIGDANDDGFLDRFELSDGTKKGLKVMTDLKKEILSGISEFDADSDGKVSSTEFN